MNTLKYLGHPGIVAILAGIMQFLAIKSPQFGETGIGMFHAWIGFAGWGSYFLAGCTPKGGVKVVSCWIGGIIASISLILFGSMLQGIMPATVAWTIATGVIAFFMICFEKVPALDMIPAWFIAAACFFGYNTMVGSLVAAGSFPADDGSNMYKAAGAVIISCIVGQIFGYVTILARTAYGKLLQDGGEETAAA